MLFGLLFLIGAADAFAQDRLLATGGVTQIEGAAGGGLVPWAVISGYETRDGIGATAFYTYVEIDDFRLRSTGAAIGFHDRVELSFAQQQFDLGSTVPGRTIRLETIGAKVRVMGDAVFDQDSWVPQVAVGLFHKSNRDFDFIPQALGARHASGTDFYVSATKLFLAGALGRNVLVNGTLRATKANQMGLLGFGGDRRDSYQVKPEASLAFFLNDRLALGAEYRGKPDNLSVFAESHYSDVFLAYLPNKHMALVAAYTWLGNIADKPNQNGIYLSVQLSL